jgi:hypothetical protein
MALTINGIFHLLLGIKKHLHTLNSTTLLKPVLILIIKVTDGVAHYKQHYPPQQFFVYVISKITMFRIPRREIIGNPCVGGISFSNYLVKSCNSQWAENTQ